jgi:hypothetical protein
MWLHKDLSDADDFEGMRWNPFVIRDLDTVQLRSFALLFGTRPLLSRIESLILYFSTL